MDNPNNEPVLPVPLKLVKSAYATLLQNNLVPRKWYPEGRYGSRTHKFKDKIRLPLLSCQQGKIQSIQAMLNSNHPYDPPPTPNDHHHVMSVPHTFSSSLCKFLHETGVKLVFKPAILSNRIPHE